MRHAKSVDDQAHALGFEDLANGEKEAIGNHDQLTGKVVRNVAKLVDMLFGNQKPPDSLFH